MKQNFSKTSYNKQSQKKKCQAEKILERRYHQLNVKKPKIDREKYVTRTVNLPDDSELTIDDYYLKSSSTNKTFFEKYNITDKLIGWGGNGAVFIGSWNNYFP